MSAGRGSQDERVSVDGRGIRFRPDDGAVFDVLFDGRRVWSIDSSELPAFSRGWREVAWPDPILRQLDGEVRIDLVHHSSGEGLGGVDASFGSGEGRVAIVDPAGHPAALTKWGRLIQPFATTDRAAIDAYLDQVEWVLGILREDCGLPAFLSFGSLLGAVREGRPIPHDVDVDLGYLSAFDNPVDVILESFRIERVLSGHGMRVTRYSGGFIAMDLKQPDGSTRNLDIFTAFLAGGRLHQVNDVDVAADVDAVLPVQMIDFEGRSMPVPAKPEVFLESAYGPSWRVPNPAFSFERPRRQRRRVRGWFGGMRERRDYWGRFYGVSAHLVPEEPSTFARWVVQHHEGDKRVLDLGCGNGRDTVYFAQQGFDVIGVDTIVRYTRRHLARADIKPRPVLLPANLESLRETLTVGARLAHTHEERSVYARFLLHALSDAARGNALRLAAMTLANGGRGYFEFRTQADARRRKHFGEHYRRYLRPAEVVEELQQAGLTVLHQEASTGLAPFAEEDPHLCRMIVERTSR